MFEVEAKVHISPSQYKALQARLRAEGEFLGFKRSEDTYYGKGLRRGTIRIRRRGERVTFDLKLCETIDGIESNTEMEWEIKNPSKLRALLKKIDIQPYIRKTKKTELYKMDGFHVELNEVRLLGYFLEIERLVDRKQEIPQAKKELTKLFRKLGFSPKDFEEKRYLELLAHV